MGKAKVVGTLAALGATIGGVVFFWRKRQHDDAASSTGATPTGKTSTGGYPPAADIPPDPSA